jgi:hypothetical protein
MSLPLQVPILLTGVDSVAIREIIGSGLVILGNARRNPSYPQRTHLVQVSRKPLLTKDQMEQVRKLAHKQAIAFGIAPAEAAKLASALIGSLALA